MVDETTNLIKAETLRLIASSRAAAKARRRAAPRTWMVKSVTEGIEEAECTQQTTNGSHRPQVAHCSFDEQVSWLFDLFDRRERVARNSPGPLVSVRR